MTHAPSKRFGFYEISSWGAIDKCNMLYKYSNADASDCSSLLENKAEELLRYVTLSRAFSTHCELAENLNISRETAKRLIQNTYKVTGVRIEKPSKKHGVYTVSCWGIFNSCKLERFFQDQD